MPCTRAIPKIGKAAKWSKSCTCSRVPASGDFSTRRSAAQLPTSARALAPENTAQQTRQSYPKRTMARATAPARAIPALVPVLICDKAVGRFTSLILRCTASLNGLQANPALEPARKMPTARTVTSGASATIPVPSVAAVNPVSTGTSGPLRFSKYCAISRPIKKPAKPRPDTNPTDEEDIENVVLNSGTNRPNPIRPGPKLMAVAAKPARDKLWKNVIRSSSICTVTHRTGHEFPGCAYPGVPHGVRKRAFDRDEAVFCTLVCSLERPLACAVADIDVTRMGTSRRQLHHAVGAASRTAGAWAGGAWPR